MKPESSNAGMHCHGRTSWLDDTKTIGCIDTLTDWMDSQVFRGVRVVLTFGLIWIFVKRMGVQSEGVGLSTTEFNHYGRAALTALLIGACVSVLWSGALCDGLAGVLMALIDDTDDRPLKEDPMDKLDRLVKAGRIKRARGCAAACFGESRAAEWPLKHSSSTWPTGPREKGPSTRSGRESTEGNDHQKPPAGKPRSPFQIAVSTLGPPGPPPATERPPKLLSPKVARLTPAKRPTQESQPPCNQNHAVAMLPTLPPV